MPPPLPLAELPLIVLPVTVSAAATCKMPPPLAGRVAADRAVGHRQVAMPKLSNAAAIAEPAELPLIVLSVTVRVLPP